MKRTRFAGSLILSICILSLNLHAQEIPLQQLVAMVAAMLAAVLGYWWFWGRWQ